MALETRESRISAYLQFWMLIEDARDVPPFPLSIDISLESLGIGWFWRMKGSGFKQQRLEVVNRWLKTFL